MKINTNAIKTVANTVQKVGGRTLLKCKKASPEIMLVGGLVVGAAAIVSACLATRKVDAVVEKTQEELDAIQNRTAEALEQDINEEAANELAKESKKASFKAYMNAGWKFAKLYAPSAGLLLLSVGLILGSHGVLKKRYVSTAAAYKALDEAFKDYRKRIASIAGEDVEQRFYNGTDDVEIQLTDPETGEVKTTKAQKQLIKKKDSPYEFDFNKYTAPLDWTNNADHNFMYLRSVQSLCNDKYNAQGHLFLNEVLDAIGLQRTSAGAVVGWVKGSDGDDFVDFGFSDYYVDDFCDEATNAQNIHLNFNVDGVIYDKI